MLAASGQLFADLPGGDNLYSALITVNDQDGNRLAGVSVQLWVQTWYGVEWDPEIYNCTKTGITGSSGTVYLECLIPAELSEGLVFMEASMIDPYYTVISSQNTWSNYQTHIYPVFDVVYDTDGDSLDDNLELQIAEKFKPVLHKHSYDLQQNLEDFERLILDGSFTLIVYNDNAQQIHTEQISGGPTALHKWSTWNWDTYGHGSVSEGVYNLDLDDSKRYEGAPVGERPLYYHVYEDAGYYYVQYWYYFGMDDKREQLSGVYATWHESDWEHVTIRLYETGSGDLRPDFINFYNHEGGRTFPASDCWWSPSNTLTYDGLKKGYDGTHTHLHIWLAANSHASYNRNQFVYKRTEAGVTYKDRTDYNSFGFDLYFIYDILVKMGEFTKQALVKCPDSGYTLDYHVYPIKSSTHWLAYVGRTGEWGVPPFVASPSPTMPTNESISHEWWAFTIDFDGFGNDGAEYIQDDTVGD